MKDEPVQYGQVWRYRSSLGAYVVMPVARRLDGDVCVCWASVRIYGTGLVEVPPEGHLGWSTLEEHDPEHWERLA